MELQAEPLDAELRPGERVLWRGQPLTSIVFRPHDLVVVPFSFIWAGFALFWEGSGLSLHQRAQAAAQKAVADPPLFIKFFFPLWGVPVVCVALYITVGRFLHMRWQKRRTWYAITDRRVLCVSRGLTGNISVTEHGLASLTSIEKQERSDGAGSLIFVRPTRKPGPFSDVRQLAGAGLVDIADVRAVYEVLVKARERGA